MSWTIDLDKATATHANGLTVKFSPVPGEPGAFDGQLGSPLPAGLRKPTPTA